MVEDNEKHKYYIHEDPKFPTYMKTQNKYYTHADPKYSIFQGFGVSAQLL